MKSDLETFYDMIDSIEAAMMTTRRADGHLQSRPMATQRRAAGADLWFVTVAGTPKLVMMDEPGAGLSQDEATHLRDVILGIPDFCGAQVLLVDHDVDLISATCQATLVLDFGSKLAYGPTAEVLKDPKVQAAYLGVFEEDAV